MSQSKSTTSSKEIKQIYLQLQIKLQKLERLLTESQKYLLNQDDKEFIKSDCGDIAAILYTLISDSNLNSKKPNISLLTQLGFSTSIRMFETKKSNRRVTLNNESEIIVMTNYSHMCKIQNHIAIPVGLEFNDKPISLNKYLTKRLFEDSGSKLDINRIRLINHFRNVYGPHVDKEINNDFSEKQFMIGVSDLNGEFTKEIGLLNTLEASLIQIGIEVLNSITHFFMQKNKQYLK
jgi:hypothetical protein